MPDNQRSHHFETLTSLDLSVFRLNSPVTRRGFMAAAAATAATAWLAACGQSIGQSTTQTPVPALGTKLEGTVNLYNWQSYINPDNVKAFG